MGFTSRHGENVKRRPGEKVREEDDVELVRCASRNMYRVP